jgi:hypothetical protein
LERASQRANAVPAPLREGVDATLRKNQRLARELDANSRTENVRTASDAVEARVYKLPSDQTERLMLALERIVKGSTFNASVRSS